MEGDKKTTVGSGHIPPPNDVNVGPGRVRGAQPPDRRKAVRNRREPDEPEVDAWHRGQPPE